MKAAVRSTVFKKTVSAVTGLGLLFFAITHLAGNLTLLSGKSDTLNAYAMKLESFGPLFEVARIAIIVLILAHAAQGILLAIKNRSARGETGYRVSKTKGGPSNSSWASRNMIVSGFIILGFLILHLKMFKWGPGIAEGYSVTIDGHEGRDLYRLVAEQFSHPVIVGFYVFSMLLFAAHLRHGAWSALQSLGATKPSLQKPMYAISAVLAILLALGFIALPVYMYLTQGGV